MADPKVLNPALYTALKSVFKYINISNQGMPAEYEVTTDFFGKKKITINHWGETYSLSCPYCRDKRTRLYISNIWGTEIDGVPYRFTDPIVCQNEGCNMRHFWNLLYGDKNSLLSLPTVVEVDEPVVHTRMEYPCDPKDLVLVNKLPSGHPALEYLLKRKFDLDELSEIYQISYCPKSEWSRTIFDSQGNKYLLTPANRLIIPNIQKGQWYGWQSRYIGDCPKDPVTGKKLLQKYLSAPGFSISHTLFNIDNVAKNSNNSLCFVNEGPFSAIGCKGYGVATSGMFPKPMQEELLASTFKDGEIIVLVESEAAGKGRLKNCIAALTRRSRVVVKPYFYLKARTRQI